MTLEAFETSFQQDLNGDGVIGIPPGSSGPAVVTQMTTDIVDNIFVFSNKGSQDQAPAPISLQDNDVGHFGNLVDEAAKKESGLNSTDWHFIVDTSSAAHLVAQSNTAHLQGVERGTAPSTTHQSLSITVGGPDNDVFVFKQGLANDAMANATSSHATEWHVFSTFPYINRAFEPSAACPARTRVPGGERCPP